MLVLADSIYGRCTVYCSSFVVLFAVPFRTSSQMLHALTGSCEFLKSVKKVVEQPISDHYP